MFSILAAGGFETLALLALGANGPRAILIGAAIVMHAIASILIGIGGQARLPPALRTPPAGVIALLASIAFFVPILGVFAMLFAIVISSSLWKLGGDRPFVTVREPEFLVGRTRVTASFRSTNAREDLADKSMPEEMRLKALLSVQDMPGRVAGALLFDLLSDHSDDMRLLAYGMLRAKERELARRIIAAMERRLEAKDKPARYLACRELAELNWEFIYQNLVSGDMRRHATRQGFNYAIEAIQIQDDDPGLWFVAGRLALSCGLISSAESCLESALERGFPRERVLSYLAECAYVQRNHDEVRRLLGTLRETRVLPGIAPVVEFWS